MASLRQIRRRIRFIQNTQQIMRAMQFVSASKLKRTQGRLEQARTVAGYLSELAERLSFHPAMARHPLCERRPSVTATALVVVTSDTGLCGAYNTNAINLAEAYLRKDGDVPVQLAPPFHGMAGLVLIGKKGYRYFTKRGYRVMASHVNLAGRPNPPVIRQIATTALEAFLAKRVDAIEVAYTRFVSSIRYQPVIEPWLPIQSPVTSATNRGGSAKFFGGSYQLPDYIFEPTPERVFEDLLPRFAIAKFQQMVLEAFTSEHSARMIAMKNATDNAEELLDELTLLRNKVRQATITKEISEIVGTAEALK